MRSSMMKSSTMKWRRILSGTSSRGFSSGGCGCGCGVYADPVSSGLTDWKYRSGKVFEYRARSLYVITSLLCL